jgi:hypothetical protein
VVHYILPAICTPNINLSGVSGMREYTRTAKFTELKNYDHFAKDNDFMEVTEWYNGDVPMLQSGDKHFQLHLVSLSTTRQFGAL